MDPTLDIFTLRVHLPQAPLVPDVFQCLCEDDDWVYLPLSH